MSATHDVIVLGGGISGLSAAYFLGHLAPSPPRVALVEAGARLGGTIGTDRVQGFLLDQGPDSFVAQKPHGRALCEEVGLGEAIVAPEESARRVYVREDGRLKAMPDGMVLGVPTSLISFFKSDFVSFGAKLRMGMDLVLPRGKRAEESIAQFIGRRFGRAAVQAIGEPLMAGIHSGRAEELSMQATFPQFVELEHRHRSIILGMRRLARARARASGGRPSTPFLSLRDGMMSLVDAVAERIGGTDVLLGQPAAHLRRATAGWEVALRDGATLRAPALVLAVKSHQAAPLLEPAAADLAAAVAAIEYASTGVVFFAFERDQVERPLDAFGFVTVPGHGRVKAATFVSSKFAGRAPEGKVLLRAFFGGARDEEVLRGTDDDLRELAREELSDLLGLKGAPLFTRTYRWDRGTPQMRLGHAERVEHMRTCERAQPGVHIIGGGYEGIGIPECIRQGRLAAERILGLESREGGTAPATPLRNVAP